MPDFIHIHPIDNVAVALAPIPKGTEFAGVAALEDIPQGHKMALQTIPAGGQVMKYGLPIGHTLAEIPAGTWVHTHNMATNTPLATKKANWIDFNAGRVADGLITLDEAWAELLDKVIRVASGEPTCAERKGFREISIFKDGVVL